MKQIFQISNLVVEHDNMLLEVQDQEKFQQKQLVYQAINIHPNLHLKYYLSINNKQL
jgi:hypothetical protein